MTGMEYKPWSDIVIMIIAKAGAGGIKMATINVDVRQRGEIRIIYVSRAILQHPPTRDPSHDHFASFTKQTD